MLVQASSLELAAAHAATTTREIEDRIQIRYSPPAPSGTSADFADSVQISDPKELLARWILEYFTGRTVPIVRAARFTAGGAQAARLAGPQWSISYTHRETVREAEATAFLAQGSVKLASGKEISFSVRLQMQREHTEETTLSVQAGNMTDPIVVNLDGAGARLTAEKMAFDLNSDGVDETIANLAAGSAWLARDINGNGVIDNGSELFGPASGNGFTELAALDQDGNRWIDEGDAAFAQLGLWRDGAFVSLAQAGIGALSVQSEATPFSLEEGEQKLGQVRSSGVFLREEGGAGVLQQVDLAV